MTGEARSESTGFYARAREALRNEPVDLMPITERNFPVFKETLASLSDLSAKEGALPVTGNPNETPEEWAKNVTALWLVGSKLDRRMEPGDAIGFVNLYAPERTADIETWLAKHPKLHFEPGTIREAYAYVTPDAGPDAELAAYKKAIGKAFMDQEFPITQAITIWETHEADNTMKPDVTAFMEKLGGFALGSSRYDPGESVDSTCFLITKNGFLNALVGKKRG